MNRRAFVAVAAAVASAGCLDVLEDNGEEITEPGDLEVVYADLGRDDPGTEDERVFVWGVVENVGDRELSYVEISATFLDAEGEELDTVIENVEDVTSGEQWDFEIEYPNFGEAAAEVEDFELEPATGV